ncbi:MAG: hypothetical protein KDI13_05280 [Alphaproteobacteria bacterium]|nr:hypothetical protein [Alphaproteobacteria bacterium]
MKFYVYSNSADSNLYSLTDNDQGENLPPDTPKQGATWTYFKSFESGLEARIGISLEDETEAETAIKNQGYYLHPRERLLKAAP